MLKMLKNLLKIAILIASSTIAVSFAAPTFSSANNFSVAENTTFVAVVIATDSGTVTYSINTDSPLEDPPPSLFSIDPDSGTLTFIVAENYENPTVSNNVHIAKIRVNSSSGQTDQSITVIVTDVIELANFNLPAITDINIDENTAYSQDITLTGEDPIGNVSYALSAADAADFSVNATNISMVGRDFENPVDDDKNNTYVVTLTATDADENAATQSWIVSITDVIEVANFTIPTIADVNIAENTAYANSAIILAGDAPIGTVTYSLSGVDAADFSVDAANGVVSMVARDFENPDDGDTNNIYEITLIATDDDANSATQSLTVSVTDTPFTIQTITNTSVNENTAYSETIVLTGDTTIGAVTYSLSGADAADFSVNAAGVVSMVARDFENPDDVDINNVYELTLTASADGKNATQSWTVSITDVIEVATFTIPTIADVNIAENTAYANPAIILTGDTPIGNVIYSLSGVDAADFSVNATTGVVSMVARDFENPDDADTNNTYVVILTVTDEDANSATQSWTVSVTDTPFAIQAITDKNIGENTAYSETIVLTGDTTIGAVSYSLSGADAADFSVNAAGVVSMVARDFENPVDFDINNVYELTLTAIADGKNATRSWTVSITDVIEVANFTIPTIDNISIAENIAYSNPAITLAGDTPIGNVIYSLSGVDAADFSVNAATGVVSMVARDFENPDDADADNTYVVILTATDEDANSATQSLTVSVTDASLAIQAITNTSVNENTAYSETIVLTGDTTIGATTYSLSGVDAADFSVNAAGVVSMVARDFENPVDADTNNIYELTLTASADGKSATQSWTVSITDVIEVATFTIPVIADVNIAENTAYANSAIILAGDTPIGNVIYSLSGVDADDFSVNATTGVVSMVARDFENPVDDDTNNTYVVTLIATDDDANSATQSWTVSVTDTPFTIQTITNTSVNENTAYSETIVLTGDTTIGAVSYSLSGVDAADFSVNAAGVVSMVARDFENPVDFDINNIYELTLTVSADGKNATQSWTVSITDVIEVATFTIPTIADVNIAENIAYSNPAITLTGETPIGNVIYSLSGVDAADFSVNPATGVVSMVARDFENPDDEDEDNTYVVILTATDDDANSATQSLTVSVTDAPLAIQAITNTSVNENTAYSETIVLTGDTTIGTATYSLSAADAADFSVNAAGVVSMLARDFENPVDFDINNIYELTLTASADGKNATQSWTVSITDVIEVATFTIPTIADVNIAENTAYANSAIILAGDAPIGTVTYSLSAADKDDFSVNAATGVVSMVARDFENPDDSDTNNTYEITLIATDDDANSATQSLTVSVTDTPFAIQAITDKNIGENTAYSETIVLTGDTTIGAVSYSLSGVDAADFSVNAAGVVSMVARDFENPVDADTNNVYELILTAIADGKNATRSWTVSIADVIEVATFTIPTIDDVNIAENTAYANSAIILAGDAPIGTVTYSLSAADKDDFSVNATTGVVSMVARDFENPDDDDTNNIYEITLIATDDDANSATQSWTVSVTDTPFAIQAITDKNIGENTAYSETIVLTGDTTIGAVTYSLSGVDAADFSVNAAGVVSMLARDFENPVDADTNNVYELTLTVSADGKNATRSWEVTITDALEKPIITSTNTFTVAENQTSVATLSATDENGAVTFSTSITGTDAGLFTLANNVLTFNSAPTFSTSTDNTYNIQVSAANTAGTTTQDISIGLTTKANFDLAETIITLTKNDPETIRHKVDITNIVDKNNSGSSHTISVVSSGDNIFTGNPATVVSFSNSSTISTSTSVGYAAQSATLYFTITPDTTGTATLQINLIQQNSNIVASETLTVRVNQIENSPPVIAKHIDTFSESTTFSSVAVFGGSLYAQSNDNFAGNVTLAQVAPNLSGNLFIPDTQQEINFSDGNFQSVFGSGDLGGLLAWIGLRADGVNYPFNVLDDFGNTRLRVTAEATYTSYPGYPELDWTPQSNQPSNTNSGSTAARVWTNRYFKYVLQEDTVVRKQIYELPSGLPKLNSYNFSIDQDSAATEVVKLTGFDLDGDDITWSYTNSSAGGTVTFTNIGTNTSVSSVAIDYQPASGFVGNAIVNVFLTDGNNSATIAINIDVELIAPDISISPATLTIDAGVAIDMTVTNSGGAVASYSISPAISNGLSFSTATGVISGLPADDAANIQYTITATNAKGTDADTFDITVKQALPTDITLTPDNINENTATGTVVGTLSTADTDGDFHTYKLANHDFFKLKIALQFSDQSGYYGTNNFVIEDVNGATHTIATINFIDNVNLYFPVEKLVYAINTMSTVTGVVATTTFVITLQPHPDNLIYHGTVTITAWPYDFNGAKLIGFAKTTNTGTPTNIITIEPGRIIPATTDEPFFSISNTNTLTTNTKFDYEEKSSYTITIKTTDEDNNSFSKIIKVDINDLDDIPTDIIITPNNINENTATGTVIGALSTADGDSQTHTYTLLDNTATFSISGNNTLITNVKFDFEAKASHTVAVRTTDIEDNTFTKTITVYVNDLDDIPTKITLSPNSIVENAGVNALIGTLSTTDHDGGTHVYTLLNNTAIFSISGNTLTANNSFDFESKDTYTIIIKTTDQDNNPFTETITVNVNDDDAEVPTITSANVFYVLVKETSVATLSANNSATFSTIITGTNAASFTLTADGVLTFNTAPDFSATVADNIYNIQVKAANITGTATQTIIINVLTQPTFNLATNTFTLTENAAENIRYKVDITDIIDENDTGGSYTFAVSANGDDIFTTNPAPVVSFSTNSIDSITTITDNGQTATLYFTIIPDVTGTATLRIYLTDKNGVEVAIKYITVRVNEVENPPVISQDIATYIDAITDTISRKYDYEEDAAVFGGSLYFSLNNGGGANFSHFVALQSAFINTDAHIAIVDSEQERLFFNTLSGGSFDTYLGVASTTTGGISNWTSVLGDFILFDSAPTAANGEQYAPGRFNLTNTDNADYFANGPINSCLRYSFGISSANSFNDRPCDDVGKGGVDDGFFELPSGLPATTTLSVTIDQDPSATEIAKLTGFDLDGDNITWSYTNSAGNGTVTFTNNSATNTGVSSTIVYYQPTLGFVGTTTLDIILTDDNNNSATIAIDVNVELIAPSITLSKASITATVGIAIENIIVSNSGGAVASYSISPTLSNGLTFSTNTGTISGTPTVKSSLITYTIIATNTKGAASVTIDITVKSAAPTGVTLSSNAISENRNIGTAIGLLLTQDLDGIHTYTLNDNNAYFKISDNSPFYLRSKVRFDYETRSSYTISITTTDEEGNSYRQDGIEIFIIDIIAGDSAPSAIYISDVGAQQTKTVTTTDENIQPGTIGQLTTVDVDDSGNNTYIYTLNNNTASFTIDNDLLKSSVEFDFETQSSYIISISTVDIDGNTFSQTLTININDTSIPEIASLPAQTYTANIAITNDLIFTNTSTVNLLSCESNPPLPAGLLLEEIFNDCKISGTPTTYSSATDYTITAINQYGSGTVTVSIAVNPDAPNISLSIPGPVTFVAGTQITPITVLNSGGTATLHAINPVFTNGLSFSTATGTISGTPTAFSSATTYTITATNITGSSIATLNITVNPKSPNISLSTTTITATARSAISNITVTNNGGDATYSISPAIDNGLSFDTTDGTISGTPANAATNVVYTITATNSFGSDTATINIAVTLAIPNISLSTTTITAIAGSAISNITVTNNGGDATYSISPAIDNGLSFDTADGTISGTPANVATNVVWTITASNVSGSSIATLSITVNLAAPDISLSTTTVVASVATAITAITVSNDGGTATYSISPALSEGLSFATNTGTISGTPSTTATLKVYTITASNVTNSDSATLSITVNIEAPNISLSTTTITATARSAISNITVTNSGGDATYSISPAITNGLSFDTTDGTISGTPANAATNVVWTITASNVSGNSTATLNITVNPAAPDISLSTTTITAIAGSAISNITVTNNGGDATYSISPAIDNALSFDTTDGTISGTPANAATNVVYTVTASNVTGTDSATLSITVNPAAPDISLSTTTVVASVAAAITAITVSNDGGTATYSISPALSEGLSFATNTGTISGTPSTTATLKVYTITASNVTNSDSATLSITVNPAAPNISLSTTTITATAKSAISNITVTNSGGDATYSISPAIDNDLSFDTTDGTISGTPSAAATLQVYTITASNVSGNSTATLSITVNLAAPSIELSVDTVNAGIRAIDNITVINTGGTATYSISPAITNGLSFNTATGTISGTPSATATAIIYTVTATNISGTDSASVSITVSQVTIAPSIEDITNTQTYFVGVAISPVVFTNAGDLAQSCVSNPDLPAGLNAVVSGDSCAINGEAEATKTLTTYTITATNSFGSDTATINIAVTLAIPNISLSTTTITAIAGSAINNITVTNNGGDATYSISPAIDNGLSFDTADGTISGTPANAATNVVWTITASNISGNSTATVNITVNPAAPDISLSTTTVVASVATAITAITVSNDGGTATYSISPTLSEGLSFATTTGTISGTPSATATLQVYTITASNVTNSDSATFSIIVNPAAPNISLSTTTITATARSAISNIIVTNSGGDATYSISPAIDNGLSFDTTDGTISGTPANAATNVVWTITASNVSGNSTATLNITVNPAAPDISLSTTTVVASVATAITAITVSNDGGTATYSILPALSEGLSFATNTGTISGTPSTTATLQVYTITASNVTNSDSATLSITVNLAAPSIELSVDTVNAGIRAIDNITVINTGGTATYSISPAITNGLSFNTANGTISGTPSATATAIIYTVTATNISGTDSASVSITVSQVTIAPSIEDITNTQTYFVGVAISPVVFTNAGDLAQSCVSNPDLPAGLNAVVSGDSCAINGEAEATKTLTTYTITATNSFGSDTATINIAVTLAIPNISLSTTTITAIAGSAINNITVTNNGGDATYSISPAIDNGLSFDTADGTISGTPANAATNVVYTITASNVSGNSTATLNITVNPAAPDISLSTTTVVASVATAITAITVSNDGGTATYSISPTLSEGLSFATTDGTISGTPSATATLQVYTITASNVTNSDSATFSIIVNPAAPNISLSTTTITAIAGSAISNITVTNNGGDATYSISPAITNGLSFDTTDGTISGTPANAATNVVYTITASNVTNSDSATLSITVNLAAPSIELSVDTVNAGIRAIDNITVINSGGTATYSISPAITNGLSFSTTTGTISGTPSATATAIIYTVTATNISGTDSASVSITVSQITLAPSIEDITNTQTYFVGVAISPVVFTNAGDLAQSCASNPDLPAGLNTVVSGDSCAINGEAEATKTLTTYTITATNLFGSDTATINIAVTLAIPNISLSTTTITATARSAISNITVTNSGGDATYSISPAIDNGLSFDTTDGTISGTPANAATNVVYTITASNVSGNSTATISITVNLAAPSIELSVDTVNAGIRAIDNITVINTGGTATYSISPAITNGLSFNTTTGTISGTPSATATAIIYTVTATNISGTDSASVSITVSQVTIAPSIEDITNTQTYFVGVAISPVVFTNAGDLAQSCASNPDLPAGLNTVVSGDSCAINGEAEATKTLTTYTITATNLFGSDTATINIAVTLAIPNISLSTTTITATARSAISNITVTNSGGDATYSISPAIDNGLSFDTTDGTISGTPSAAATLQVYTITASNVSGNSTATLSITVNLAAPSIELSVDTVNAGIRAIDNITVINTGGTATYSISPAITNGLSFSTANGTISGTPSATATAIIYTVTATNISGTDSASVSITVSQVTIAPSIEDITNTQTYFVGVAISPVVFTNAGDLAQSCVSNPDLPAGLNAVVSGDSCAINGEAEATKTLTTYTITATNSFGSDTATINIAVTLAIPNISLSTTTITAIAGSAISNITVTNNGGDATYSISPAIDNGLSFDTADGTISGTPANAATNVVWTITASNISGNSTATVNITVNPAAPDISLSTTTVVASVATAITAITVSNDGGTATYSISPALSEGLSFATNTGTISGTPSTTATLQVYTITASNVTNSDSATLSITVNPVAITFSLDADGNQTLNATNDGLIIFKYLLNPDANNLHTTIANDATEDRKTSAQLKAYLDNAGTILDVDGNQTLNATNDGLIIFKYLLNPDANNLHTTIANDALESRKTTPELKAYLDTYK